MPDPRAKLVSVADAVAEELRRTTFTLKPAVGRTYNAKTPLADAGTLHVDVVAGDQKIDAATRDELLYEPRIDIAVRKRFDESTEVDSGGDIIVKEMDRLVLLVEEIAEFFVLRPLELYADAKWTDLEFRPIWSPQHFDEWRQFTGIVAIQYEVVA